MSEFSVIEKYFSMLGKSRCDVVLGVGDDAALVNTAGTQSLAISVDTLIEGVHFPATTDPYDIGWKSLAVNLSDMAAMGAKPRWATLALTLPNVDESWLKKFSQGFSDLATQYDVQLIGGDTTRGTLSISVQIMGGVIDSAALKRDRACAGDAVYVTGFLGDAALGLKSLNETLPLSRMDKDNLLIALNRPIPRVNEALQLSPYVNAAIDISDGLAADLLHVLKASNVAGVVDVNYLPVSELYGNCHSGKHFYDLALCGGDDYELCFTVSKKHEKKLLQVADKFSLKCTRIGEVVEGTGLTLVRGAEEYLLNKKPYNHFN